MRTIPLFVAIEIRRFAVTLCDSRHQGDWFGFERLPGDSRMGMARALLLLSCWGFQGPSLIQAPSGRSISSPTAYFFETIGTVGDGAPRSVGHARLPMICCKVIKDRLGHGIRAA